MVVTKYNNKIPKWVSDCIKVECDYCGYYILDNSDTGVMTSRQCSNPYCPGHMQYKALQVLKYFHKEGKGEKAALAYIKRNHCKNHLEILKDMFDEKPTVKLSTVAILADIEGLGDTKAVQELDAYASFDDYFANKIPVDALIYKHRDFLRECQQYFNISPPLSKRQMWVMGTGSFHGYVNRQQFFTDVNNAFGEFVHVIEKGKRKSGISYLIKENDAVDHSKSKIASECGIPVVTPREFVDILCCMFHP